MFNFISDQANMGLSFDNLEKTDFIPLSENVLESGNLSIFRYYWKIIRAVRKT